MEKEGSINVIKSSHICVHQYWVFQQKIPFLYKMFSVYLQIYLQDTHLMHSWYWDVCEQVMESLSIQSTAVFPWILHILDTPQATGQTLSSCHTWQNVLGHNIALSGWPHLYLCASASGHVSWLCSGSKMQAITLPLQTVGSLKYENICSVRCKQDKAVLGETGFYYLKKSNFSVWSVRMGFSVDKVHYNGNGNSVLLFILLKP